MLLSTIPYLLLPAAVVAAPAPFTEISPTGLAIREAEGIGLAGANSKYCYIVGSDGPVNCRLAPNFGGAVHTSLYPGEGYTFSCYAKGACYEGIW